MAIGEIPVAVLFLHVVILNMSGERLVFTDK